MTELRCHFTVVILAVGVSRSPSYWMRYHPTVYLTRFVSFLCGHSMVRIRTYVAFLYAGLSLCYMKKIVFVPAGMSDPHTCASRSTSLIFTLSHSCLSLLLSRAVSSDWPPVFLLMAEPAKWRYDLGVRLDGHTEGGLTFVAASGCRRRWPEFTVSCSYVVGCAGGCTTIGTCAPSVTVGHNFWPLTDGIWLRNTGSSGSYINLRITSTYPNSFLSTIKHMHLCSSTL